MKKEKLRIFYPLFLAIGLRYVFSGSNYRFASFISILSMLGITLGVCALIVVCSVMNGMEGNLKDKIFAAIPHAIVTTSDHKLKENEPIDFLNNNPLVENVSEVITEEIIIQGKNELTLGKIYGINPKKYPAFDIVKSSIGPRAFNHLEANSYEIFIGDSLADILEVEEGDKIRITIPSIMRYSAMGPVPTSRLFTVAGIYKIGVGDVEATTILAHINDVRKLVRMPKDEVTGFRVWLSDPFKIDELVSLVKSHSSNLTIDDWREEKGDFFHSVQVEKIMVSIMLSLIILVAVFNMLSALVMVVTNKISEIAILRTMGISQLKIVLIFMVEGAFSGIMGSIFGVILGLLLVHNIDAVLGVIGINAYLVAGAGSMPVIIDYSQIALIVLGTMILSFIITIYPSLRGAYLSPATSLRYE
ncbi:MAG: lipoprotein-releasing ABC transporter permease subunit [Succinivibrionaceae bacterium]|nr:lipoprotein-releasing ABC transporter permease subunit [Succinivibrionaceae bacterium]